MLNALPDTRTPDETSEVFLASKDKFSDNAERKEDVDAEEKQSVLETIILEEQRPLPVISQKSESSNSVDLCKITSTVEIGKKCHHYLLLTKQVRLCLDEECSHSIR